MKIWSKILILAILAIMVFSIVPETRNVAMAGTVSSYMGLTPKAATGNVGSVKSLIERLLGLLQMSSGLITVIMIAFMGFNYIVGTPQVKEEMKKTALPILIGVVLVFGAVSIARFIIGAIE